MTQLSALSLAENERTALLEATRSLRERFPVASLVLFGSKSRGDSDPESDIDILVLTSRKLTREERDRLSALLFDIGLEHDVVLSPLVVPVSEWQDGLYQVLPIRREIDQQGIPL
jgi:predicted nucleotidyltransferase